MTRLLRTRLGGRLFALIALESILILCAIALARFRFSRADLDSAQRAIGRAAVPGR